MAIFEGVATALITPFNDDESVNFDKLKWLIDKQIDDGVDAFVITGTTAEAATLTEDEHIEVIAEAVKQVNGRVPVIAGTGSNCTRTAIDLSRRAEAAGADAVLLVSPYYNKATQQGLYEHFKDTCDAIKIPAVLYNIKSRTGVNIEPVTIARLAKDVPNIKGVKEASGDISQIGTIASLTEGMDFSIYSGNDDQVVPICALGGKGVISVASHVIPRAMHDIVRSFLDGDTEKALKLQNHYLDLMHKLFIEVNPIPVKEALNIMGYGVGPFRKPLCPMSDEHRDCLRETLKKYDLL